MIDFTKYLQFDTNDNMYYYFIPKSFPIYRGDTSYYIDPFDFLTNTPYFFGTNIKEVEEYGVVFEFRTTQDYKLLAIDKTETLKVLYNIASSNKDIQQIIEKNYGYITKKRDSVAKKDIEFSKWLCEKGYSGYAINNMEFDLGTFHQEIMVCHAESIQLVKQITTDPKKIKELIYDKKMVDMKKSMDLQRKKRFEDKPDDSKFRFENIPMLKYEDTPPTTPKKIYFGGNKTRKPGKPKGKNKPSKPKGKNKTSKLKRKNKNRYLFKIQL